MKTMKKLSYKKKGVHACTPLRHLYGESYKFKENENLFP